MGDIKSTLELVMERTKGLTLSQVEKREQETKALKQKLTGIYTRYEDRRLNDETAIEELSQLLDKNNTDDLSLALEQALDRIQIDSSNHPLIDFIENYFSLSLDDLNRVIDAYADAMQRKAERRRDQLKKEIADKHRISGSAVNPHLAIDPQWLSETQSLKNDYQTYLQRVKTQIVARNH